MKKCKCCHIEKNYSEYTKTHKGKYYNSYCKSCTNKKSRKWHLDNPEKQKQHVVNFQTNNPDKCRQTAKKWMLDKKDGYHYVYHIADTNYVGITCNPYIRKNNHTFMGRDLNKGTGFQILSRHTFRKEALQVESYLHSLGFNGGGNNNDFLKSNI
jgi:hypothetical protein